MKPVVALIGRPNVGKSTLFNRIVGYRHAIVEDTPGVTRDRLYSDCEWLGKHFRLVDTGGINDRPDAQFVDEIKTQVDYALVEATVAIFIVDAREGINPLDQEIATYLRTKNVPVIVACNKVDTVDLTDQVYEFYNLGFEIIVPISAEAGLGVGDLLDEIISFLPESSRDDDQDPIKIAIVGRPNVGKSSLTNKILGQNRTIVSDMPGTTRDSIDSFFRYNNQDYILIDTAGLRRKSKITEDLERYSASRTIDSIERCDISLILIDANTGITEQDKRIAGHAHENGKGCIMVVNKWDIYEKDSHSLDKYKKDLYLQVPFLSYAPIVFISALTGQRIPELLELIEYVSEQQNLRVPTGILNTIIEEAVYMTPPPTKKGRQLKILYGTQTGIKPPVFVLFVNSRDLIHFSYQRYLENVIREAYGFTGTPIRWKIKERSRRS
jgi:GTP-binding protein